ncbi:helix-turn-helix transcriptional regulator, partial [Parabacteroides distasonis]
MANLKNAAIREMVLDKCLSNHHRKYSTEDLKEECNKALALEGYETVQSLNTIRSDMRAIEQRWGAYGGMIEEIREGRNKYYSYANAQFSIYNAGLSKDDLNRLNQAMQVLSRFQGLPQFEWIHELNVRFKSMFMFSPNTDTIISFDDNIDAEGRQHISKLFHAIVDKVVLSIRYKPFDVSDVVEHTVHPYFLKEYNNRWFLLGLDEHYYVLTTFALDRILSISTSHKKYVDNDVDFAEYFDDVIGVTVFPNEAVQKVKLWVAKEQYPYIRTKPLHGSQKVLTKLEDENV